MSKPIDRDRRRLLGAAALTIGKYTHRTIKGGIGHNLPQEAPQAFAQAVVEVDGY